MNKKITELVKFIEGIEIDVFFLSIHEDYGVYLDEILDILRHYDKLMTASRRLAKVVKSGDKK